MALPSAACAAAAGRAASETTSETASSEASSAPAGGKAYRCGCKQGAVVGFAWYGVMFVVVVSAGEAMHLAHTAAFAACGGFRKNALGTQSVGTDAAAGTLLIGRRVVEIRFYIRFAAFGAKPYVLVHRPELFFDVLSGVQVQVVGGFVEFVHLCSATLAAAR